MSDAAVKDQALALGPALAAVAEDAVVYALVRCRDRLRELTADGAVMSLAAQAFMQALAAEVLLRDARFGAGDDDVAGQQAWAMEALDGVRIALLAHFQARMS